MFGWVFATHQLGAATAALLGGLSRDVLSTYLPAFYGAGTACLVRTVAGSLSAVTPDAVAAGQAVTIAVRPERLRITPDAAWQPGIAATVAQHVYLGSKTEVHATLKDGGTCVLELANDGVRSPPAIGQAVTLTADAADCRVFPAAVRLG